ncbi:MAG TPA: NAD(P)/FAD-dependent oxidoreductase [Symbiobacteriaceae bacterium]|nr:NAD(P)/FAD-dependent oxidoreductase [Symbiobacteriaceae bacterium]
MTETYDAIIIGGGSKGMVTAMYLAKYGGMKVAVFEKRHELGGGWSGEEHSSPGFVDDSHASNLGDFYVNTIARDFNFFDFGAKWLPYDVCGGAIYLQDEKCITVHGKYHDPNQEKTAKAIARYSERDAETWLKWYKFYEEKVYPAFLKTHFNPPCPRSEKDPMEQLVADNPDMIDPSWASKSPLEVLREQYESDAVIAMFLRLVHAGNATSPTTPGMGLQYALAVPLRTHFGHSLGGTHTWAHAASRILFRLGVKTFTKRGVQKVVIENGRAVGVLTEAGELVRATQLVVSGASPQTLVNKFIGREYFSGDILSKIDKLEMHRTCITWYHYALHELPNYSVSAMDPDVNRSTGWLYLAEKGDPMALVREHDALERGEEPEELNIIVWQLSQFDKTRAPDGKHLVASEQFVLPAFSRTDAEWAQWKTAQAKREIEWWQRFAPNMTWDNVIGYNPLTPRDTCHLDNLGPYGNWATIDHVPHQLGRNRPIPELSDYRTPVKGLYATGGGWHPGGAGWTANGYNTYKVIAEDYGLGKPWKDNGYPY